MRQYDRISPLQYINRRSIVARVKECDEIVARNFKQITIS